MNFIPKNTGYNSTSYNQNSKHKDTTNNNETSYFKCENNHNFINSRLSETEIKYATKTIFAQNKEIAQNSRSLFDKLTDFFGITHYNKYINSVWDYKNKSPNNLNNTLNQTTLNDLINKYLDFRSTLPSNQKIFADKFLYFSKKNNLLNINFINGNNKINLTNIENPGFLKNNDFLIESKFNAGAYKVNSRVANCVTSIKFIMNTITQIKNLGENINNFEFSKKYELALKYIDLANNLTKNSESQLASYFIARKYLLDSQVVDFKPHIILILREINQHILDILTKINPFDNKFDTTFNNVSIDVIKQGLDSIKDTSGNIYGVASYLYLCGNLNVKKTANNFIKSLPNTIKDDISQDIVLARSYLDNFSNSRTFSQYLDLECFKISSNNLYYTQDGNLDTKQFFQAGSKNNIDHNLLNKALTARYLNDIAVKGVKNPITNIKKIFDNLKLSMPDYILSSKHNISELFAPIILPYENSDLQLIKKLFVNGQEYKYDSKFKLKNNSYIKIEYLDDRVYEGNFIGRLANGRGKLVYPDGKVYEGNFVDGLANGRGKLVYPDGKVYEGNFVDGLPNGKGFLSPSLLNNRSILKYEGNFVDGELDGKIKVYPNQKYPGNSISLRAPSYYEADFKNGKMIDGNSTYFLSIGRLIQFSYDKNGILTTIELKFNETNIDIIIKNGNGYIENISSQYGLITNEELKKVFNGEININNVSYAKINTIFHDLYLCVKNLIDKNKLQSLYKFSYDNSGNLNSIKLSYNEEYSYEAIISNNKIHIKDTKTNRELDILDQEKQQLMDLITKTHLTINNINNLPLKQFKLISKKLIGLFSNAFVDPYDELWRQITKNNNNLNSVNFIDHKEWIKSNKFVQNKLLNREILNQPANYTKKIISIKADDIKAIKVIFHPDYLNNIVKEILTVEEVQKINTILTSLFQSLNVDQSSKNVVSLNFQEIFSNVKSLKPYLNDRYLILTNFIIEILARSV